MHNSPCLKVRDKNMIIPVDKCKMTNGKECTCKSPIFCVIVKVGYWNGYIDFMEWVNTGKGANCQEGSQYP